VVSGRAAHYTILLYRGTMVPWLAAALHAAAAAAPQYGSSSKVRLGIQG
jgi:hypothetical protein